MALIPRTIDLAGTLDGNNRIFVAGVPMVSVDYATADGTQRRENDANGFTVDLTTGTFTFNFAPQSSYRPWTQYIEEVPDPPSGGITGTLATNNGDPDIHITRGQDFTETLYFTDDAGVPVNLTGVLGIYVTIKRQLLDVFPALISKSVGSGITITNASAGITQLVFVPADTALLDEGRYMYDKWIIDSSGKHLPAGIGAFIIEGRGTVL